MIRRRPETSRDLGPILERWPDGEEGPTARVVAGTDGKLQLQLKIDCGVLQMDLDGRPDGTMPHNCPTFLDYLQRQATASMDDKAWLEHLAENPRRVWSELDREMTQFYHRRIGCLAVARIARDAGDVAGAADAYRRVVRDADYTLGAMDFIRDYSHDQEYIEMHERLRPFVLWHRTIAQAHVQELQEDVDQAIEQIKRGRKEITQAYVDQGLTKWASQDPSLADLQELEQTMRARHAVKATLNEQLEQALANEDFEGAARIRDELRSRGRFQVPSRPAGWKSVHF